MDAIEAYRVNTGCGGADRVAVVASLSQIEEDQKSWFRMSGFGYLGREARDYHTLLAFTFADTALSKGCLGDADETYRDLIALYSGSNYAGIRACAQIGIDDARARR